MNLESGGAERCLFNVTTRGDANAFGHSVVSLMGDGAYGDRLREAGVPVYTLNLKKGQFSLSALYRLWKIVRAIQPSVIQTWMSHANLAGSIIGTLCRVPVIWNIRHGSLDPRLNKRSSLLVVKACALISRLVPRSIVFCSEASSSLHAAHGYCRNKSVVIANGVDTTHFSPRPDTNKVRREWLDVPEGSSVIGLVARYDPLKDHQTFVRASALVRQQRPDCYFVLAGAGVTWENSELVHLIDGEKMRSQYRLLGQCSDVRTLMSSLDFLCSSSLSEGFPNVIAEAMACGVPCAATKVGGTSEIVGNAGELVSPGSAEELAQALQRLLQLSPGQRRALAKSARERIVDVFNLESMTQRYETLYRNTIGIG